MFEKYAASRAAEQKMIEEAVTAPTASNAGQQAEAMAESQEAALKQDAGETQGSKGKKLSAASSRISLFTLRISEKDKRKLKILAMDRGISVAELIHQAIQENRL